MRTRQRSLFLTRALAVYVVVGGAVSFLGWLLDLPRLTDWDNDLVVIQPNAALAATLAGAALWLDVRRRRTMWLLGLIIGAIGAATLFEHMSGMDLGIDTPLMFGRPWGRPETLAPGRMGIPGSVSFAVAGAAIVLLGAGRTFLVPALGLLLAAVSALSLIGRVLGADLLYAVPQFTTIALQTATFVFAVGIALVTSVPERDPTRTLLADTSAGVLARQTFPFLLALPVLMAWLALVGTRARVYDDAMGLALLVLGVLVVVSAVVWLGVRAMDVRERALVEAQAILRTSDERLRRQADELRDADRKKDEFLATLAHELRNPLAPLRTGLQLLDLTRGNAEAFERTRTTMTRQVDHLVRLIDDLMDVSRITRGIVSITTAPVPLATIVEHAVEISRPAIESNRHRLTIELPPYPVLLEADQARLVQVLSNLLNNAAKFTPPGGNIAVRARVESADAVVVVADDGVGIAPHLLGSIFDMFAQGEDGGGRVQSGLGIGLSLVRGLVELHGGTVEARSGGVGKGSEFILRLPLAGVRPPAPEPNPTPAGVPGTIRRKVLIVDDNVDAADSLALMLRLEGHDVETARDGEEALRAAAGRRPELIFLDLRMPGADGYEVCRRIRALPWGRDVLIVALTGWGQDEQRRRSYEAGFDRHLVKPADPAEVRRILMADLQQVRAGRVEVGSRAREAGA